MTKLLLLERGKYLEFEEIKLSVTKNHPDKKEFSFREEYPEFIAVVKSLGIDTNNIVEDELIDVTNLDKSKSFIILQ
jgi:hypothetical protein